MKRTLISSAVLIGLTFGGPQIVSNAAHQFGGPRFHTGQALASVGRFDDGVMVRRAAGRRGVAQQIPV